MDEDLQTGFALVNPPRVNLLQHELPKAFGFPQHMLGFMSTQANERTKGEVGAVDISRSAIF